MPKVMEKLVYEYASSMSLLIVDDDQFALQEYRNLFENFFNSVDTAKDGLDAYNKWNLGKKKYDLIITDILMPNMNGFELISKIRLKSPSQHILVLSAIKDINQMRSTLTLGVEGILEKPYNQQTMIFVLSRVLKLIYNEKLIKRQAFQLKLLAQKNISTKADLKEVKEKENPSLKKKITVPIHEKKKVIIEQNESAVDFTSNLDYFDIDRVEVFQDKIEKYQNIACQIANENSSQTKTGLSKITQGLLELIEVLNHIGTFSVTVNATKRLIGFVDAIEEQHFEDYDKKDLFIDGIMSVLEDLYNWIDMVFVQKDTDNVNYFDASFSNTCLELEHIFESDISQDDDSLDFF